MSKVFDRDSALSLIGWAVRNPVEFADNVYDELEEDQFVHEHHYDALGIIEIVASTYGNLNGFASSPRASLRSWALLAMDPSKSPPLSSPMLVKPMCGGSGKATGFAKSSAISREEFDRAVGRTRANRSQRPGTAHFSSTLPSVDLRRR